MQTEKPMPQQSDFSATFWGVRGSIPVPGKETVKYGGNTPCLELRAGEKLLLIDAGTGIRNFARQLSNAEDGGLELTILLSHTHWDHIQGIPFLGLAYDPRNTINIIGPKRPDTHLMDALQRQMRAPNFPVPFEALQGIKTVKEIEPGTSLTFGEVTVRTAELNHPDRSMGFRVEYANKALAYCLDHEHTDVEQIHPGLAELGQGADLLVFDAAYCDETYPRFKGWGHSTWQVGHQTAQTLDVKTLALCGYNPDLTDRDLDEIAAKAEALPGNTLVTQEGATVTL
ncbi:MAG: MBL fold metallo-hydrolase [OM182 bacterium]|nr:MAG: MBL fold metallo-hydrolase [OM182 bacterium]